MTRSDAVTGRVLHAPMDIAGQASRSVCGLRRLGIEAALWATPHPFGYEGADIVPPEGRLPLAWSILQAARNYETFHFHYGLSFHPRLKLNDARALRAIGRRVAVEFHGSDVRMPSIESARNPHYVRLAGEDDAAAERLMARWATVTDGHAIICDSTLRTFLERHFDQIHLIGKRVDVARYQIRPPAVEDRPLVVVHAPSNLAAKGTTFVRAAAKQLGGRITYIEVTGRPQRDVMAAIASADVVVDHLAVSGFGVLAIEAMSMAKPVVCYLLPDYEAELPQDCPIIRADPLTITDVLSSCADTRADLHQVGLASRDYVERNHDVTVVAGQLLEIYARLPVR